MADVADLQLVLEVVTKGHDETAGHLKGIGGAIGGLVEGLGKFGLAGMGLSTISNAFQGLAADAIESEKVMAATNAVLASTQGVSGMTAESVSALATSLSKVTPFEDELIQSTENLLLTFTAIGKDTMPAVTEAALNMATAMGTDPKEAAIQLGKAMQDPITGATALRRVGVALSEQQQEAIKHFMAVGDIASAQAVILKELGTEFGGAAKAAGETFGGKMAILQTQLGNLKEAAFTPLLGVIGNVATGFTDLATNDDVIGFVSHLADLVGKGLVWVFDLFGKELTAVQALIAAFTTDAGAMGIVLDKVRDIFGNTVADGVEPFVQAFMGAIPEIQRFAALVMELIRGVGNIISDVLSGDVGLAFDDFREVVAGTGTDLVVQLRQWAQAFLSWIGPMIPPLLAQLQDLGQQVYGWILETALPALVESLGQWAAAFVDWVAPQIEPLLHTLGELATNMLGWMVDTALPLILSNLLKWGVAFVEWVAPRIPPLLLELGKLLLELGQWALDTALPAIIGHLEKWGTEFVAWVAPQIPPLLAELGALLEQIGAWLLDPALPTIALKLGQWAAAFVNWVIDVVPQIPDALKTILDAIADWVTGPGGAAVADQAGNLGSSLIQGFVDGIAHAIPNAIGAVGDAVKKIAGAFGAGFAQGGGGGGGGSAPTGDIAAYIRQSAVAHGIDPATAIRVAMSEGGVSQGALAGDSGSSFGPFQLHYGGVAGGGNAVGGLGDAFTRQTGLNARDPSTVIQQIDFALSQAAAHGWAAWHGAARVGISDWQGIGTAATTTHDAIIGFQGSLDDATQTAASVPDSFKPLDQSLTDLGLDVRSLSDTSVQSFSTIKDAARFLSDQFGISVGQATNLVKDHGSVARTVLGEAVPGAFTVTDRAVERFADAFKINWDQARAVLEAGGATSELVMGTTIPASAGLTNVALVAATAGAGGLTAALNAIPKSITTTVNTIFNTGGPGSSAGVGSQSRYSTQTGGPGLYVLPDIVHGGSQTVQANSLGDAVLQAAIQSGVKASAQAAGGTFGTNTSPTLFDEGGPVLGPLGAPVSAIVHGGEYVLPAGSWGGGIDYTRLATAIAAALGVQPIVIQVDGQAIAQVSRTGTARWNQANGSLAAGVGGL